MGESIIGPLLSIISKGIPIPARGVRIFGEHDHPILVEKRAKVAGRFSIAEIGIFRFFPKTGYLSRNSR
jgi:hypothetical protein